MGARLSTKRVVATLLLPALALLLLGAHFFRAGLVPLTVACLALLALLFVRSAWAARTLQVALMLGTLEWLRAAWGFASARAVAGQPYGRLLMIIGGVALFTALAAIVLESKVVRQHFRLPGRMRPLPRGARPTPPRHSENDHVPEVAHCQRSRRRDAGGRHHRQRHGG